ncbi:MAG: hypothetical protein KF884_10910 [Fimbriimonadaceae bacterium]|nr:MAG: hypothetical protein KF884_10910 [Fimbriimonadaceae bacterium]
MTERIPNAEVEHYRVVNITERQSDLSGRGRTKSPRNLREADLKRAGRRFRDLFHEANLAAVNDPNKSEYEAIDNEPPVSQELDRDIAELATIIFEFFDQWKQQ